MCTYSLSPDHHRAVRLQGGERTAAREDVLKWTNNNNNNKFDYNMNTNNTNHN